MNWKRILQGEISISYCPWQEWTARGINKYWSGRIFNLTLSRWRLQLDCRVNWVEDQVKGS